jgi:hypothetical protein
VDLPAVEKIAILNSDVTDDEPVERRVDTALVLDCEAGARRRAGTARWAREPIEIGLPGSGLRHPPCVLKRRDVRVSEAARDRILGCNDIETLEGWLDQAMVVERIEDLFG